MTRLKISPHKTLSELLLKQHGKVMTVKMDDCNLIRNIPIQLKLIHGGNQNGTITTSSKKT